MFQNVNESTIDMKNDRVKENAIGVFSNVFSKKYIL